MPFDEAKTSLKMTLRGLHGRLQSLRHRNITHHSKSLKMVFKIYTSKNTVVGVTFELFCLKINADTLIPNLYL